MGRKTGRQTIMERGSVASIADHLGCSFPVKCRFVYAAWLALLRLPYQRCWQKLRKQTNISQESYSPGQDSWEREREINALRRNPRPRSPDVRKG